MRGNNSSGTPGICRPDRRRRASGALCRGARSSLKNAPADAKSTAIAKTNCPAARCKIFAACCATDCAVARAPKTGCPAASARLAIAIASASTPTTAARSVAPAATSNPRPRCKPAANAAPSAATTAAPATSASTARRSVAVTTSTSISRFARGYPQAQGLQPLGFVLRAGGLRSSQFRKRRRDTEKSPRTQHCKNQ